MPASDSTRSPHGAACPLQVNKVYNEYAMSVQQKLHAAGFHADVDLSQNTLPKMIRNAQQAQYNFILVVGEKEADTRGVTVRTRDSNEVAQDIKPLDDLIAEWLDIHLSLIHI